MQIEQTDVVVVGSGGAGLTAAIVAARLGLRVVLLEKTPYFGGTTAYSGGGIWVPNNQQAQAAGLPDSPDEAMRYIQAVVGPDVRQDLAEAFVTTAPRMVDFLQQHTTVRFTMTPAFADWHPQAPGFKAAGRLLMPDEFDGRTLGRYFNRLRPALREFNAPGGMMFDFADLPHIPQITKSWKSFRHIAKLLIRFAWDRLRYPRGTRLVMGNALAASLLRSALDAGVDLRSDAPMQGLVYERGRVQGVRVLLAGGPVEIQATRGVILASGGFSANEAMRQAHIPFADQHVSLVCEGNTGDGLNQALSLGARWDGPNHSNAGWVVVSTLERADGPRVKFPHLFLDRGKPGCIAINHRGQRFGNESTTNLVEPMHRSGSVPAYLICDDRFIRKYGLGLVRPGGLGLSKMLAAGYVQSAPTLTALATRLGVDPVGLEQTVARFNGYAAEGVDPDFGRGGDPSDFAMGDRNHQPNPCLGPIEKGPFYAVRIYPGDSTTTLGLRVNAQAQVLDDSDTPIPGLQAVGLDMNSLWRGRAPGNGANNTLSLTFGYVAACALAQPL